MVRGVLACLLLTGCAGAQELTSGTKVWYCLGACVYLEERITSAREGQVDDS